VLKNKTVVINNGVIIETGNSSIIKKYASKNSIEASGKYLMPALWDMHMHFGGDTLVEENKMLLSLFIAMGVTTVRDCAGDISLDVIKWKHEIDKGILLGPTIFTSGPKLEGPKSIWPGDLEIANETELKLALDSLQKLKVDFIKITDNTLSPPLFLTAIKESRKRGWKVSAHAPVPFTLQELSDAGLSTIEHLGYLLRAASTDEKRIAEQRGKGTITAKEASEQILKTFDANTALQNFKKLAANGSAVVPTMNGSSIVAYLDKDDHKKDAFLKYLGPALKRTYNWRVDRASKDNAEAIAFRHTNFEAAAALIPLLQKAGVVLLAGTDAGYLNSYNYPGIGLHYELAMMVKYGLTPAEALQASVINGPAFFNQQQNYGAVEKGKNADLLLLDQNPLTDITNTQKIKAVIRKGKYLDRQKLDDMLLQIEKLVSQKEKAEPLQ
jgi:imidazolonepropionase-like amidohydrolase